MPEAPVMPVPVVEGRITIDIFRLIRNIGIGTISAVLAPAVFKFSIAVIEKLELVPYEAGGHQPATQQRSSSLIM